MDTASVARPDFRRHAIDIVERIFLLFMLGLFLFRFSATLEAEPYKIMIVLSEVFTAALVLIRRTGDTSGTALAWFAAIFGTFFPLMVVPEGVMLLPAAIGGSLMFAGLMISLSAKVFLARSFGIVAANRGVKRGGPYRLVRHPMYLGYMVTHVGFLLTAMSVWNLAVYAVSWAALILRIHLEEQFLSQDPAYRDYKDAVSSRLVPGVY